MEELMNAKLHDMSPAALTLREDSHSISKPKPKPKPKIRIVHLFAPEIIKTDVANFRELVQRLTGKPAKRTIVNKSKKAAQATMKEESKEGSEQERIWRVEESLVGNSGCSSYSLSGLSLGDADGFFQGFADFNPMHAWTSSSQYGSLIWLVV